MWSWVAVLDFCAIFFAFVWPYHVGLMSVATFGWAVMAALGLNLLLAVFVTYAILRLKRRCMRAVLDAHGGGVDESGLSAKHRELEAHLAAHLRLQDLAEFAFGPLGRVLTNVSLLYSLFFIATQALINSGQLVVVLLNPNRTDNASAYTSDIIADRKIRLQLLVFTAAALAPLLALAMLRRFRKLSGVCVAGAATAMAGTVLTLVDLVDGPNASTAAAPHDAVFVFLSSLTSLPQFGGLVLSIEGSMRGCHRQFRRLFAAALGLTAVVICVLSIDLGVNPTPAQAFNFNGESTPVFPHPKVMVAVIVGNLLFFPVVNFPCLHIAEAAFGEFYKATHGSRRDDRGVQQQATEEDMLVYFSSHSLHVSVFERLRRGADTSVSADEVILRDRAQIPWKCRFVVRTAMILMQLGFAWVAWNSTVAFKVFVGFEALATFFSGYIIPISQFLRVQWFEVSLVVKATGIVATLVSLALASFTEIAYFIEFDH